MDDHITVRKTTDEDGEKSTWALFAGADPVVVIRTAESLPKARAVEYLFRELVSIRN